DRAEDRHEHAQGEDGEGRLQRRRDPGEVEQEDRALEQHEEHDRAGTVGHAPGGDQQERDHQHGRGSRAIEEVLDHARSRTISPRRPFGLKMRIRMRIENAKMSLYSAPKAPPVSSDREEAAKASSSPSTSPPSIAPGTLPMPPRTAAVKALS